MRSDPCPSQGTIAVVVCTYRRPERMPRAVEDVLGQQGFDNQTIILVDDGSDDDGATDAAIDDVVSRHGDRIDVVRHPVNRGVAAARTSGLERAVERGAQVVCFHDDDDLWLPDRLAAGFAPFADPRVALTYGDQDRISDSFLTTEVVEVVWSSPSRGYRAAVIDGLIRGRVYFPFQTAMFRADLAARLLPFMPVRESEDVDFALRAMQLVHRTPGMRAVRIPRLLAYHVSSIDSLSATDANNEMREDIHREIFSRHVPDPIVDLMFSLSRTVVRPAGILLGRARRL